MGIFSVDGKLAGFLNKLGDLMVLNLLTILCCLPLVTIGAAMTALYANTLKMAKNEEGSVVREYFRAFRANFKQATVLWLTAAAVLGLIGLDLYVLRTGEGTFLTVYRGILMALFVFIAMIAMYLFPVLARFENSTGSTAKNAALFCMIHIVKSVFLLLANLLPLALLLLSYRFLSVDVLLGLSGPAFLTSIYYRHVFKDFEVQPAA